MSPKASKPSGAPLPPLEKVPQNQKESHIPLALLLLLARHLQMGAAAVVHCMNEAELVDVALAVLAENLDREEEGEEKAPAGSGEERELQPPPSAAPAGTASAGAGSDRGPAPPAPPAPGARAGAALAGWEDSEDDALKYVREIFFS
ncbi:cell cycle regulator of non-homologous end joining isoform X1 [Falco rusticolus]|uniref:cell cycle regulator of non-homologous end joining isoform X1 n=1 Tax=Falco rusticolus TaxID=120794 RepID=UPI001886A5B3|nr:cell cycle regulator of non-homologous end joining isoform X1 [Falco rusticolus]